MNCCGEKYYAFDFSVILPAHNDIHRRGEASMVQLDQTSVMIAYTNHRSHMNNDLSPIEGDNDTASIFSTILDASGQPMGEERELISASSDVLNVMSPAMRWLPDGKLGMLYSYRKNKREASRHFVISSDRGNTWSSPCVVASGGYVTGCHDRFTVLSDGRLVAPLHRTENWDWHYLYTQVAYSDDCGATWSLSNEIKLPYVGPKYNWRGGFIESGCVEPSVAERADGSLLMSIRTAMGTLYCAESFNRGERWENLHSMEVISPQAPAHLSRIPNTKDLLLIWTPNYDLSADLSGVRNTIMACISTDGGKTWPHQRRKMLVYEPNCSVDYPAVLYRDDEVWVTLRRSSNTEISGGCTSSGLMQVPLLWLYK